MGKKQAAVILVALAVVGAAVFYMFQPTAPPTQDEFSEVDDWLSEMEEFLNFENQSLFDDLETVGES